MQHMLSRYIFLSLPTQKEQLMYIKTLAKYKFENNYIGRSKYLLFVIISLSYDYPQFSCRIFFIRIRNTLLNI